MSTLLIATALLAVVGLALGCALPSCDRLGLQEALR